MSKGLKGITVKIDGDTKPLNQALSKVNSESKKPAGRTKGHKFPFKIRSEKYGTAGTETDGFITGNRTDGKQAEDADAGAAANGRSRKKCGQ